MYKISIYVDGVGLQRDAIRQARDELAKMVEQTNSCAMSISRDNHANSVTTVMITQDSADIPKRQMSL